VTTSKAESSIRCPRGSIEASKIGRFGSAERREVPAEKEKVFDWKEKVIRNTSCGRFWEKEEANILVGKEPAPAESCREKKTREGGGGKKGFIAGKGNQRLGQIQGEVP